MPPARSRWYTLCGSVCPDESVTGNACSWRSLGKIDIGLTNFFFPNSLNKVNKYLGLYLGPNKYTQYYTSIHNLNHYKGMFKHRNKLNTEGFRV
jgi:hypothetical protein